MVHMKKTDHVGELWFNTKTERLHQRTRIGFAKTLWRDISGLLKKKSAERITKRRKKVCIGNVSFPVKELSYNWYYD